MEENNDNDKSLYSYWIAKKLQMSTFLQDLQNGESFSNAITRLQTMGALMEQVIQENIDLYVDEEDVEAKENEEENEEEEAEEEAKDMEDEVSDNELQKVVDKATNEIKLRSRSNTTNSAMMEDAPLFNNVVIPKDKQYQEILENLSNEIPTDINDEQKILRLKIQKVQLLKDISPRIKSLMIQKLMMNKTDLNDLHDHQHVSNMNHKNHKLSEKHSTTLASTTPPTDKPEISVEELHCEISDPFGCKHYLRNCKSQCIECGEWVMCNFCHDEKIHTHSMQRNEVEWIACLYCGDVQKPEFHYCQNDFCTELLASYFCPICKLYDNDEEKDIYHCEKCGICRIGLGLGLDYFHCDTCQACMPIELFDLVDEDEDDNVLAAPSLPQDSVAASGNENSVLNDVLKIIGNTTSQSLLSIFEYAQQDRLKIAVKQHQCIDGNTKSSCPICGEYMFTSLLPVMYMQPCSHAIHKHCFDEYTKHSYKCPMCQVTIIDMELQFKILDQEIQLHPLPDPYNDWKCVYKCNDCNARGICQYHILGLKCGDCFSFNTVQLKLIKQDDFLDEELKNLNDYKRNFQPSLPPSSSSSSANNSNLRMIDNIVQRNNALLKNHFGVVDATSTKKSITGLSSNEDATSTSNKNSKNQIINGINGDIDNFMNEYLKDDHDLKFSSLAQGFKIYLTKYYHSATDQSLKREREGEEEEREEGREEEEKEEEKEVDGASTEGAQELEMSSLAARLGDIKKAFTEFIKQQGQLGEDVYE